MANNLQTTNVRIRRKAEREQIRARETAAAQKYLEAEQRAYTNSYQAGGPEDPRYQTIDEKTRASQSDYSSVAQTRDLRKQAQKQEEESDAYHLETGQQLADNRTQHRKKISKLRGRKLLKYRNKGFSPGKARRRIRTVTASWPIILTGLSMWLGVSLIFWIMSLVGLGTSAVGDSLFDWVPFFGNSLSNMAATPGLFIFSVSWIIIITVGWLTLVGAMIMYSFRRVHWMRSLPLGILLFCFPLYAAPILNVVPWFVFFVLAVIWSNRQ